MSGQRDTRLFLADVVGALVTKDKVLTDAAKAAVRELDQAGIALSGRVSEDSTGVLALYCRLPPASSVRIAGTIVFSGGIPSVLRG